MYPNDIRFADDADEQEDFRDISFTLPPTPDWQLPIDAFFSRRTASAPATIPSWREHERQAMLRELRDNDPRSTTLELPHDACTAGIHAPGSRFVGSELESALACSTAVKALSIRLPGLIRFGGEHLAAEVRKTLEGLRGCTLLLWLD